MPIPTYIFTLLGLVAIPAGCDARKKQTREPRETVQAGTFEARCQIDADGDENPDVIGLEINGNGLLRPIIYRTADSHAIWKGGIFPEAELYCVSSDWFVIDRMNNHYNISRAQKPGKTIPFAFPGKLEAYGTEENCIAFRNAKKEIWAIDLTTKSSGECSPSKWVEVNGLSEFQWTPQ
jgi:hypothetical protein